MEHNAHQRDDHATSAAQPAIEPLRQRDNQQKTLVRAVGCMRFLGSLSRVNVMPLTLCDPSLSVLVIAENTITPIR